MTSHIRKKQSSQNMVMLYIVGKDFNALNIEGCHTSKQLPKGMSSLTNIITPPQKNFDRNERDENIRQYRIDHWGKTGLV